MQGHRRRQVMWRRHGFGVVLALPMVGCAAPQPATPLPNPARIATHEWVHGPPWGAEEQPWVAPQMLAYGYGPGYWDPDYWGPGYWAPGYWGPSVGFGRRGWRGY